MAHWRVSCRTVVGSQKHNANTNEQNEIKYGSGVIVVNCPTRLSLLFIVGFLCWSQWNIVLCYAMTLVSFETPYFIFHNCHFQTLTTVYGSEHFSWEPACHRLTWATITMYQTCDTILIVAKRSNLIQLAQCESSADMRFIWYRAAADLIWVFYFFLSSAKCYLDTWPSSCRHCLHPSTIDRRI